MIYNDDILIDLRYRLKLLYYALETFQIGPYEFDASHHSEDWGLIAWPVHEMIDKIENYQKRNEKGGHPDGDHDSHEMGALFGNSKQLACVSWIQAKDPLSMQREE